MPRHIEIVLGSIFKILLVIVRNSKQAVHAFIRRFMIALSHRRSRNKVAIGAPVRDVFSRDTDIQLAVHTSGTPSGSTTQPNQSLTPSWDITQNVPNDKSMFMVPFSPETLRERVNETQGKMWVGSPQCIKQAYIWVHLSERTEADDIPVLKVEFTTPAVEVGWTRHIHPEGAIYYHNEVTVNPGIQSGTINENAPGLLTRCDLCNDQGLLQRIMVYSERLYNELWDHPNLPQFHRVELVIEIVPRDQNVEDCRYYFVDHGRMGIFWLDEYKPSTIYHNVKGVQAQDHIGLAIQAQYWYPSQNTLIHSIAEAVLSESALTPYTATELQQMLDLTSKIIEGADRDNTIQGPTLYVIARMKYIFMRTKFINFYGQIGARLNADQSLYLKDERNDTEHASRLFHVVNIILLTWPREQLENLRCLWVDQTIILPRWKAFVTEQTTELAGFTTYSTVMLAVNVSFLAVPGIISQNQPYIPTPMMIPVYISTMCCVGSLVSALLLSRQDRGKSRQTAKEAVAYMLEFAPSKSHMEWLAIIYSLPISLIMWGMISFVVALCITMFSLDGTGTHTAMSICFALVAGMALSPVLWRLHMRGVIFDRLFREKQLPWSRRYP